MQERSYIILLLQAFADGLLQCIETGGEEIFSTLRNDELLESKYVLFIERIKTRHSPLTGTLTDKWIESTKVAIVMDQINRETTFYHVPWGYVLEALAGGNFTLFAQAIAFSLG